MQTQELNQFDLKEKESGERTILRLHRVLRSHDAVAFLEKQLKQAECIIGELNNRVAKLQCKLDSHLKIPKQETVQELESQIKVMRQTIESYRMQKAMKFYTEGI